uniref:Uncharacterized protein n=1 Tax=Anopheles atroparvus TaxID=41427 RepID=A0A182JAR5_ANOAO
MVLMMMVMQCMMILVLHECMMLPLLLLMVMMMVMRWLLMMVIMLLVVKGRLLVMTVCPDGGGDPQRIAKCAVFVDTFHGRWCAVDSQHPLTLGIEGASQMAIGVVQLAHHLDLIVAGLEELVGDHAAIGPLYIRLADRFLQRVAVLAAPQMTNDLPVAVDRLETPDWHLERRKEKDVTTGVAPGTTSSGYYLFAEGEERQLPVDSVGELTLDHLLALVLAVLPAHEAQVRLDRRIVRAQIVAPQMVALLAAERVQGPVAGVPEAFLVARLHERVVHVVAALLGNVQLVAELADEADAQYAHVAAVVRINVDRQDGGRVRRQQLIVREIEVGDLLQNFAALRPLQRQDAELLRVIAHDGAESFFLDRRQDVTLGVVGRKDPLRGFFRLAASKEELAEVAEIEHSGIVATDDRASYQVMMLRESEGVVAPERFLVMGVGVLGVIVEAVPIVRLHYHRFVGQEVTGSLPAMAFFHHSPVLNHLLCKWQKCREKSVKRRTSYANMCRSGRSLMIQCASCSAQPAPSIMPAEFPLTDGSGPISGLWSGVNDSGPQIVLLMPAAPNAGHSFTAPWMCVSNTE